MAIIDLKLDEIQVVEETSVQTNMERNFILHYKIYNLVY